MTGWIKRMAMVALVTGVAATADAASPVGLELGVDVVSKYVWRGQLLTDDPVLQPSVTVSYEGLSFNVWGSIDMTDVNELGDEDYRLQEVDYTLSYAFSPADGLDVEAGIIYYDFPGTPFDATQEVYGSVSLSSVPLAPTLTVYYDIDEVDGIYATLGVGHVFELTESLGLSVGAGLGWADEDYNTAYFGVDESALEDVTASVGLDYAVNDNLGISVFVGYSELLDDDIEGAVSDPDVFTAGVSVTFAY